MASRRTTSISKFVRKCVGPDPHRECRGANRRAAVDVVWDSTMGVWQGVAMDSLKYHLGPPCPTLLCPAGGPPLKRLYGGGPPTGHTACGRLLHPTPYAYVLNPDLNSRGKDKSREHHCITYKALCIFRWVTGDFSEIQPSRLIKTCMDWSSRPQKLAKYIFDSGHLGKQQESFIIVTICNT
jgi:hypothetical protein